MGKNARSVLGMVCLLAWLAPVESWAQGSLWGDVKAVATQVVRDKIKAVPTAVTTSSPSPQPSEQSTSQPVATSVDAQPLQDPLEGQVITTLENANLPQLTAAKRYWIYAAMSQNVYRDRYKQIELPSEWTSMHRKVGLDGFYAETFVKKVRGNVTAAVIAFRGTDIQTPDWVFGNALGIQQLDARKYADQIIAKYGDVTIEVTGHSLGGALAQNISNNNKKIKAIVFDTSPMDGYAYDWNGENKIVHIFEEGEFLGVLRDDDKLFRVKYNFINNQDGGISNHAMYPLAKGMKELAVSHQDTTPLPVTNAAHVGDNATSNTTSGLSGYEVAKALDPTKEQNRAAAIAKMVRQSAIRSPLTADELAAILKGTTGGNRSYAIAQLSTLINPHLSAPEAATVLGSVNELREQNRAAAIRSLVRTSGPGSWGAEASEPLNGSTGGNRSYAIAQLVSRLRANLTGMEVAAILGQPEELREQSRAAAIRSLVDAGRLRLPFSGDELSLVLTGTTGGNRSYAIGLLTKRR